MDDLGRGATIFGHLKEDKGEVDEKQWEDYVKIWAFRYVFMVSDTHARNVLALDAAEEGKERKRKGEEEKEEENNEGKKKKYGRLISVDEMNCLEDFRPMRPRKTSIPFMLKAMPVLEQEVARYVKNSVFVFVSFFFCFCLRLSSLSSLFFDFVLLTKWKVERDTRRADTSYLAQIWM